MLRLFRFAIYFIVGLVGLVFALLNAQVVPFNYYFGSREIPWRSSWPWRWAAAPYWGSRPA